MASDTDPRASSKINFRELYEETYGEWSFITDYEIDPKKTALIVIDMQPAFTDSSIGYLKAYSKRLPTSLSYFDNRVRELVIPNIQRLLEYFRRRELFIAYVVTWSETEDLSDMDRFWRRAIVRWEEALGEQVWRKWNEGMQVRSEIAPLPHELVISKRTSSAFASSMLPYVLKNAGIDTAILVGCNTNGCVFSAACVGCNMGYDLIMASDTTACFSPTLQEEAEVWIARHFAKVCTTQQTIDLLDGKAVTI